MKEIAARLAHILDETIEVDSAGWSKTDRWTEVTVICQVCDDRTNLTIKAPADTIARVLKRLAEERTTK